VKRLELTDRGIAFEREATLHVPYNGRVAGVYRPDVFVDRRVVVELKATRAVGEPEKRQLIHYLCATNTQLGLLLHLGPEANFFRVINSRIRDDRSAKFRGKFREDQRQRS
jgi:GxxExxY protein